MMLGYVTMGTNNIEKAADFYDELFTTIGASRVPRNNASSPGVTRSGIISGSRVCTRRRRR